MTTESRQPYSYQNYKAFLRSRLDQKGPRGSKAQLAKAMKCQLPYLSRVLNGDAHLNQDQTVLASNHFGLSREETSYFLLLLGRDRANTPETIQYFEGELEKARAARLRIENRIETKKALKKELEDTYYSEWWYAAVHMAISVRSLENIDKISSYLGITRKKTNQALHLLLEAGLIEKENGKLKMSQANLHLSNESPNALRYLQNWKIKSMDRLNLSNQNNMHYFSVVSFSKKDLPKLREIFLNSIETARKLIRQSSPEDCLLGYGVEIFDMDHTK